MFVNVLKAKIIGKKKHAKLAQIIVKNSKLQFGRVQSDNNGSSSWREATLGIKFSKAKGSQRNRLQIFKL